MDVQIISMRLTRNQVENVRAFFTVDIGPVRLIDCYVIGTRQQPPTSMRISLPGRRNRDGVGWKTLVMLPPDLMALVQRKALIEYQRLIEPVIERNSPQMPLYIYAGD